MAIVASDLVAYASINVALDPPGPTSDTTTTGGAIDLDYRVIFTDLGANDDVEVVSAAGGDTTQSCTVVARDATGASVTQTVTLNGTTAVIFSALSGDGIVTDIQSFGMDADAVGIVTLRRSVAGTTISTVPIGERGFIRLFRNLSSAASAVTAYEKIFWKNTHATLSLLTAIIKENADPTAKVEFALEDAIDDTGTVTNRLTAPAAGDLASGGFSSSDQALSTIDLGTADLAAGLAIGVWIKLSLLADDSPIQNTYTTELSGSTAA